MVTKGACAENGKIAANSEGTLYDIFGIQFSYYNTEKLMVKLTKKVG